MKFIKIIFYIFILAIIGLLAFNFYPQLKEELFGKIPIKNTVDTKTEVVIPETKISAPAQETEFDKTATYGELDCNNFKANSLTGPMLEMINRDRLANGKKELAWSTLLCQSAKLKAEDMIKNNYFEHISPAGVTPWSWIEKTGYRYTFSGENLALNYYTAGSAHDGLMNSPGHRANILNENFTQVGLAYFRGTINGQEAFVVVQHFAAPAPKVPPVKYICETKKAEEDLKDLKKTKQKIDDYLDDAEEIKKQLEDNDQNTKEVDKYIDDMEDNKDKVKKYIKEIEDYLKECDKLTN